MHDCARRSTPVVADTVVTRRVRPEAFQHALQRAPEDIKVIAEFAQP
jgi:hypothetical protein